MNRRGFLGNLFKGAIGIVISPYIDVVAKASVLPSTVAILTKYDDSWRTYTINGYTFHVKHNPIFDSNINDKPLRSHRMIFLDDIDNEIKAIEYEQKKLL